MEEGEGGRREVRGKGWREDSETRYAENYIDFSNGQAPNYTHTYSN